MSETNVKSDWAKRDVGALWKREGKNQKYLSGYVKVDELGIERELKIVVFSNKNKNNNDKAPDYRIYVSAPLAEKQNNAEQPTVKKVVATQNKKPVKQEVDEEVEEIL